MIRLGFRGMAVDPCVCPSVPEDVTIVKFQTIVRDGKEIVVGRIKVPTVSVARSRSD